uniref:Alternative protein FDPS n=1 Tax=Homo sapiens TaxID=9606 RepID=L8EC92_HUMAN|nr:alternative protein FDPS [Homo sapiens]
MRSWICQQCSCNMRKTVTATLWLSLNSTQHPCPQPSFWGLRAKSTSGESDLEIARAGRGGSQ